jgi:hypothetical protein
MYTITVFSLPGYRVELKEHPDWHGVFDITVFKMDKYPCQYKLSEKVVESQLGARSRHLVVAFRYPNEFLEAYLSVIATYGRRYRQEALTHAWNMARAIEKALLEDQWEY